MRQSKIYVLNGIAIWILWLFFRFGYVLYLIYVNIVSFKGMLDFLRIFVVDQNWLAVAAMPYFLILAIWFESLTFGFLNSLWFYKITQGIIKVAAGGKNQDKTE